MMRRTSSWIVTGVLAAGLGLILFTALDDDAQAPDDAAPEIVSPRFEAKQKQALVDQDTALTSELCRRQCIGDLTTLLRQLENNERPEVARERLAQLRQEHPHMIHLIWEAGEARGSQQLEIGKLDESQRAALKQQLREAEQIRASEQSIAGADKGMASPTITIDGEHYLVLTVPNPRGGGITSVVKQSILSDVRQHQRNNLRLVPYPPEGNYQIESVDSDTKQDIHVDSGEENGGASHYHKQQVVVKFKASPSEETWRTLKQELQASSVRQVGHTYLLESRQMTAEQMLEYLERRTDVEYAEPHYVYMTNGSTSVRSDLTSEELPNDYLFDAYQWNLPMIQTLSGWTISKGSGEVIIGVLDTGVDLSHPDLTGRLVEGANLVTPGFEPLDDVGHGTHVAGVISASVNNGEGIAGMTWYDKVMPVKVLGADGAGTTYSVAEGLIWAADHGAKVINMSLGNYADAQFLHDAIRYAYERDVVLIAATGNDNTSDPGYPAAYPEVLAVSAVDDQRNRAPFSNYGDYVDVVAPGVSIASTYPHNQYAALSGTSMASPHAAALAALIRAVNPALRNDEVMDMMRSTAIDLGAPGRDPLYGYGQIDVHAALAAASGANANSVTEAQPTEINNQIDHTLLRQLSDWFRRELERVRASRLSS